MPKKLKKHLLTSVHSEEPIALSPPDASNEEIDRYALGNAETLKRPAITKSLSQSHRDGGSSGSDDQLLDLNVNAEIDGEQESKSLSTLHSEEDVAVDISQIPQSRPDEQEADNASGMEKDAPECRATTGNDSGGHRLAPDDVPPSQENVPPSQGNAPLPPKEPLPLEKMVADAAPPSPIVPRTPKKKRSRLAIILLAILLVSLLAPSIGLIIEGVHLYPFYADAHDGTQHLLNVKGIFSGQKTHLVGLLDEGRLHQAQQELTSAHQNFLHLSNALRQDPAFDITMKFLPQQITSARALSKIGLDTTEIGQRLIQTALQLAPSFRGPLLADTQKPLVTPAMIALVRTTIDYLLPRLSDIQLQQRSLTLAALPISPQQRQQLTQLLQLVPQVQADLTQGRALLNTLSWMLGVNEPRTFLIQTMDRAELRPTGGFTGQFGELMINGGRLSPFSLKNIGPYEENNPHSPFNGQLAPAPYTWWPIPNWGLRDSNLSADFPTSARMAIQLYKREFGHQVDGVILFSPFLISHILQITGPITLPEYQETITAQNLEARLHYYQLDNVGIRKEEIVEHVPDSPDAPTQARKLFTAKLARMLMDQVRHAPPDELLVLASQLLFDMKTRDLQVYVTNQEVENLLIQFGGAGQMDRSNTHDGLYVVQANVSASKASQYVSTLMHDTVSLDAAGGATHVLQLRLVYNQTGPVYGLDTYHDYVRIYVPPTAQFRWGDGFDSGMPLCGGPYRACPLYDVYHNGDLLCPPGLTQAGYSTSLLNDPYAQGPHPIDKVGPPTNMQSDEAGRAMFAGWVIVPKNCTMTITLSWYVPPIGHAGYTLLIQRQSSTFPALDLTILALSGHCKAYTIPGIHFSGIMGGQDMSFSLPANHTSNQGGDARCVPLPAV